MSRRGLFVLKKRETYDGLFIFYIHRFLSTQSISFTQIYPEGAAVSRGRFSTETDHVGFHILENDGFFMFDCINQPTS